MFKRGFDTPTSQSRTRNECADRTVRKNERYKSPCIKNATNRNSVRCMLFRGSILERTCHKPGYPSRERLHPRRHIPSTQTLDASPRRSLDYDSLGPRHNSKNLTILELCPSLDANPLPFRAANKLSLLAPSKFLNKKSSTHTSPGPKFP